MTHLDIVHGAVSLCSSCTWLWRLALSKEGWLRRLEHSPAQGAQAACATVRLECGFYSQMLPDAVQQNMNPPTATAISSDGPSGWGPLQRGGCRSSGLGDTRSLGSFKVLGATEHHQVTVQSRPGWTLFHSFLWITILTISQEVMPFDTLNKVQENFDQGISDSFLDYAGWCERSFFLPRLLPTSENI